MKIQEAGSSTVKRAPLAVFLVVFGQTALSG